MKILLIEDDVHLADAIRSGLEQKAHVVDILHDGNDGENRILARQEDYDIIILDLTLPGKNGFEICKHVRSLGATIPIIILTGRAEIDDKVTALDSGADDYLVKPFSFDELLVRIHALVRRPKESLPPLLRAHDLILNPVTREVSRKGEPINLTVKEFEFLQYLMRNVNHVLGREDIFAHLWDFEDSSLSNVIDVHVKNLRRKIDRGHAHKLIETVRGVGYIIKD